MAELSGNSCNIITILPMGLSCDSINASTPESTNGLIALYVTGGTPPYNITWNNGLKDSPITNLTAGVYTAVVTDFYGDFTATTTCEVGYDSFYLESFEDCENNGNFIYYLADLPSDFINGKIYKLNNQNGCWVSSGTTIHTGQTYYNFFAQTSYNSYESCEDCLPQPEPPIVYPEKLCMTIIGLRTSEQISFSSGSTINNQPSWTSSTPTYTMYYNTTLLRWELLGWVGSGLPSFNYAIAPPVGNWTVNGYNGTTVTVTEGECQGIPLSMTINPSTPSCVGVNNGSVVITGLNGTPPYTYSIDGVNYGTNNSFIGLGGGTYTVYTKDSNNQIVSNTFTLTPQSSVVNYNINFTLTPAATEINTTTNKTKTWYWKVDVTPTLPTNKTVNFNLNFGVTMTGSNIVENIVVTNQNCTITTTTNGTATISSPNVGATTSTGPTVYNATCKGNYYRTSAYTTTYVGSITGPGYLTGTVVQTVQTPSVSDRYCALYSSVKTLATMTPISLVPSTCSTLDSNTDTLNMMIEKTGQIIAT